MTHLTTVEPQPIPHPPHFAAEEFPAYDDVSHHRLHGILLFIGDCMIAESRQQRPRGYVFRSAQPGKT